MGEVGCLKDGNFQNLQVEGNMTTLTNVEVSGTMAVTGNMTASGTMTVTGNMTAKQPVVALTAARQILATESGTVFTLDSAGGAYTVTLPTVALGTGCRFRFIAAEDTPTADITIKSNAANIVGTIQLYVDADAAHNSALVVNGKTNILFDTLCLIGDHIEIVGNGTNYFISGAGSVNGAFTMS
jgi:hypothetical protein